MELQQLQTDLLGKQLVRTDNEITQYATIHAVWLNECGVVRALLVNYQRRFIQIELPNTDWQYSDPVR